MGRRTLKIEVRPARIPKPYREIIPAVSPADRSISAWGHAARLATERHGTDLGYCPEKGHTCAAPHAAATDRTAAASSSYFAAEA